MVVHEGQSKGDLLVLARDVILASHGLRHFSIFRGLSKQLVRQLQGRRQLPWVISCNALLALENSLTEVQPLQMTARTKRQRPVLGAALPVGPSSTAQHFAGFQSSQAHINGGGLMHFAICPAMRWPPWLHMISDPGFVSDFAMLLLRLP